MVTDKTMAVRTAKNIVSSLNAKGVKCSSDYQYKPVRKVLRECWYVKKLVECGRTDCIHIGLDCGSFIAVTDDCKLMSGFHVMIQDAVYSIYMEYVGEDFDYAAYDAIRLGRGRLYHDDGDCGMFIVEPSVFVKWVESLDFVEL